MTEILLVSHGLLAEGIIDSMEMLIGEVSNVEKITFSVDMGIEELQEEVKQYLSKKKDKKLLIFTDLKGGTPFNVTSILTHEMEEVKVFYGMNLPIIIEAVSLTNTLNFEDLIQHIENNVEDSIGFSNL